jgi:hypothetical protein
VVVIKPPTPPQIFFFHQSLLFFQVRHQVRQTEDAKKRKEEIAEELGRIRANPRNGDECLLVLLTALCYRNLAVVG